MQFTVYTGDGCPNCKTVVQFLKDNGIKFQVFNVNHHPKALTFLKGKGFSSIPQVYMNGAHITGYDKDGKFKKLIFETLNKGG